ncbi:hypothetical protein FKM82_014359 [Ascaphus truei]
MFPTLCIFIRMPHSGDIMVVVGNIKQSPLQSSVLPVFHDGSPEATVTKIMVFNTEEACFEEQNVLRGHDINIMAKIHKKMPGLSTSQLLFI